MLGLDEWMVAWDRGGDIKVGPWPDKIGWSDDYMFTSGCCYLERRSAPNAWKVAMMFIDFHSIVVRDKVDSQVAHKEFCKIGEFCRRIARDLPEAQPLED